MHYFDNILTTALLGTEKRQLTSGELTPDLAELYEVIKENADLDNEEKFLQIASLGYNYRRCGFGLLKKEGIAEVVPHEEVNQYCSDDAIKVLEDILEEESDELLKLWLDLCLGKRLIVHPVLIPVLLSRAAKGKSCRNLIVQSCGKRGEWLINLNKDWHFLIKPEISEQDWGNGTAEQRRKILRETREKEPVNALEMLKTTWQVENANSRAELLKQLETGISDADIEWLESLLTEKSQKVKDEALRLLKMVSGSHILQQYWNIIKEAVQLKREKGFLGIGNKIIVHIQAPVINDEAIYKSGIDKLSKDKNTSDDDYILMQLIREVHPENWEEYFNSTPHEIIGYFEKDEKTKKFLDGIAAATLKFKEQNWALQFAKQSSVFYADLIPLLPVREQEQSIIAHLTATHQMLTWALSLKHEWSLQFAKQVIKLADEGIAQWLNGQYNFSTNHIYNNKSFYKLGIHLIPVELLTELKSRPQEGDPIVLKKWEENTGYLVKLLTIKQKIYKVFA